ncbi:MAG: alpha/beta hydrolase [Bacilli bacterium]|jgi:predicted alpha/beta superfamily hydrolase
MKKKFSLLMLTGALMLVGCGPRDNSSKPGEDSSSIPTESSIPENVRVLELNVKLPYTLSENERLTIGSNLNSWRPNDLSYEASKVDDLNYRLTLDFDISERSSYNIQYKWTIQTPSMTSETMWAGVEKEADGVSEIENRVVTIKEDSPKVTVVNDTVKNFADYNKPNEPTVVGNLDIIENMDMPEFSDGRKRTIRVWTPSNYDPNNKSVTYPVIYMHDGQNLFDNVTSFAGEWQVDETMERFLEQGKQVAIIVGIDNSPRRMEEYTPDLSDKPTAEGGLYAKFIVETLKPYIDSHYNTKPEREHTMIAGSSMGGLISFYAGLKHKDTFGMLGCFSSSFQINSAAARQEFIESLDLTADLSRIYLDSGKNESLWTYVNPVADELFNAGYPAENIFTLIDENGSHNEASWSRRFPDAYSWLMSNEPGNYEEPPTE